MSAKDPSAADPLGQIADEFAEAFRQGRRPSVEEFARRYPEQADEIRAMLPALVLMEKAKCADDAPGEGGRAADPATPAAVPPPRQLGDYQILREIGHGGMGVVYDAEQVSLGRHVALKVLTPQLLRDDNQRRRFEREAKAAAKLHHTNIVPVFGTGEHDGTPYYVMQFIQGTSLDVVIEELARMGPGSKAPTDSAPTVTFADREVSAIAHSLLTGIYRPAAEAAAPPAGFDVSSRSGTAVRPSDTSGAGSSVSLPGQSGVSPGGKARKLTYWQSVARVGVQVADALEYAHRQGVVHRDVKPSNLLLDLAGTVWVTDFGLAKADGSENLTHTGDVLGTLRYLPPEAFDGKADARGDVYALGLTLYELVALRPAFDARDRHKLIKLVTTAEPEPVGRVRKGVPRDLETIIHKAIDRDPARRYQTAGALESDLQRFLDDEPIHARRSSSGERLARWCRRNPALAGLLAAVALLLLGVAVVSTGAAFRIAAARDEARQNAQDADQARQQEAEQRQGAEEQAEESRRRLVRFQVDSGAQLVEQGDLLGALPRFAEALRLDPDDAAGAETHRLRLAATLRRSPRLVTLWAAEAGWGRAAFDPAGRLVASANLAVPAPPYPLTAPPGKGVLRIWDVATGRLVVEVAHEAPLTDFAFSPDGRRIATASKDGTARVWDVEAGDPVTPPLVHKQPVNKVSFSPDGRQLVTAGDDRTARVWDARGTQLHILEGRSAVQTASFSDDGKRLVTHGAGWVSVWDAATGSQVMEPWWADVGRVSDVQFSADGRHVVAVGGHVATRTWDIETRQLVSQARQRTMEAPRVWLSADRRRAMSAGFDWPAQVWDVGTGQAVTPPLPHIRNVLGAAFTPQGDRIVTTGRDGAVRVWDAATGAVAAGPLWHGAMVTSGEFSPDGRLVVTRDGDGLVRVWDLAAVAGPALPWRADSYTWSVQVSPDGRRAVTSRVYAMWRCLWLRDARTGRVIQTMQDPVGRDATVRFSPDSSRLVLTRPDGATRVWESATGVEVAPPARRPDEPTPFARGGAGQLRATGGSDGVVRVCDAATGKVLFNLLEHTAAITGIAFSPDGRRLLTASEDGTARLWESATGQPVAVFRHDRGLEYAAFGPDGYSVITGCVDGTVRHWTLAPTRLAVEDATALAGLLAGRRGDPGGGDRPDAAALLKGWQILRSRYSQEFTTSQEEQFAWHRAAVEDASKKKAWQTVLVHLTRLVEINPAGWQDRLARARLLARLGQEDEARREFDEAVRRHADNPQVWVARGSHHLGRGRRDRAAADFTKAIERQPASQPAAALSEFWVAGLYPLDLEAEFPPESQQDPSLPIPSPPPLAAAAAEKGRGEGAAEPRVDLQPLPRWRNEVVDATGFLDLAAAFDGAEKVSAYTLAYVWSKHDQEVVLLSGSDDGMRLWLNGDRKPLFESPKTRGSNPDEDRNPVTLRAGWNVVLAKVVNYPGNYGLFLRLSADPGALADAFAGKGQLDKAILYLGRLIETQRGQPGEAQALFRRGFLYARRARWQAALDDYVRGLELAPEDHWHWYTCATVRLMAGGREDYRRHCQEMLRRFAQSNDPTIGERAAKASLIVPDAVADLSLPLRLIDRSVTGTEKHWAYSWFLMSKGIAEYRAGRFAQAVDWLRKGEAGHRDPVPRAEARLFLAMAYQQLGRGDEARRTLDEAVQILDTQLPKEADGDIGEILLDWVFCQVARREAEALIEGKNREQAK
jgi:eukaryotic-like serine/threonine-protein kinase